MGRWGREDVQARDLLLRTACELVRPGRLVGRLLGPLHRQSADELDEFLDGAPGRGRPHRLLTAVGLQLGPVQQCHQPGDVLYGSRLGGGPDRLVGAVRVSRRPGQQGNEPGDVLHGPVHADRAQSGGRGLGVLGRLFQQRDQVNDVLQGTVGHGGAHQVADGIAVRPVHRYGGFVRVSC